MELKEKVIEIDSVRATIYSCDEIIEAARKDKAILDFMIQLNPT